MAIRQATESSPSSSLIGKLPWSFMGLSSGSYPRLACTLEPGPTLPMNTTRTAAYLKFHERNIQYKDRD